MSRARRRLPRPRRPESKIDRRAAPPGLGDGARPGCAAPDVDAAVLQHLQVLEDSGLVRSRKVGRVRTCSIEVKALQPADRWIEDRRSTWEGRLDRLGAYLADDAG